MVPRARAGASHGARLPVCLGEVVEVADEIVDPGLHVGRVASMWLRTKIVEVVDRLHRRG